MESDRESERRRQRNRQTAKQGERGAGEQGEGIRDRWSNCTDIRRHEEAAVVVSGAGTVGVGVGADNGDNDDDDYGWTRTP